jgi:hypothetical protein
MQLRLAPGRRSLLVAVVAAAALAAGCGAPQPAVDVVWEIDPESARSDRITNVAIVVRDRATGQPVRGATLTLEGHMSHPGMSPVVVPMTEAADGRYESRLTTTMAGGWTLVISGALPDGRRVTAEQQLEVGLAAPAS